MKINPTVFREYDVRGYVDRDLSDDFAYFLGRGFARLVKREGVAPVAIGWDCRLSSPGYAQNLAEGIADEGLDVTLTGLGPTPQLYFSLFQRTFGGGIQVTGSHNPADMNGFKLCLGTRTLAGEDIQQLRKSVEECLPSGRVLSAATRGKIGEWNIQPEYIAYLIENSKSSMGGRKLKVVVDAGNGVGGLVGPAVLRGLGVEVIELFCDPDGRFPNHHPDPTELHNIETLIARVRKEKADFGIGWDGDADRIGVVDDKGNVLFGDMLVLLYAREILKNNPGASIIGDVKCSARLFKDIKDNGGNPIMWKTGHSLIKAKLRETGALLAGEMSGHIFFKHRFFGFDDALYASSRFAELVSHSNKPVSEMLADLPPAVSTPEIRVDCAEEVKFKVPERAKELFRDYRVDTTDGVRIEMAHGWGLIRASNTQPVLVLRFEADSEEHLSAYQTLVMNGVAQIKAEFGAT